MATPTWWWATTATVRLALLTGGLGGLSLFQTLTSADAPNPTDVSFGGVSDGLLNFYVSTAGHEAATNLTFDLNASPESEGGGASSEGGGTSVAVTPSAGLSVGGVLSEATSGAVEQVALLLSLTGAELDLAATLLTVSVVETESSGSVRLRLVNSTGTVAGQGQRRRLRRVGRRARRESRGSRASDPVPGGEDAAVAAAVDGI